MATVSTFYFSRIIGNKIYSNSGRVIGVLKDLIVEIQFIRPKVVAIRLTTEKGTSILDFSTIKIKKINGQYRILCSEQKEYTWTEKNVLSLSKNILDRQIIDMDGRKLVRVNVLKLAILSNGTYLIAVDVGFEGLLRRLGVAKPIKHLIKPFGWSLPNHLILWDEVETVDYGHAGIKLLKDYSKLEKLHPSDLADIIEEDDFYNNT